MDKPSRIGLHCGRMTEPCFEDLHEGQTFVSTSLAMTAADILAFAAEFDPQPMHVDPDAAARTPVGGLIASGWHTAAVAMRLQRAAGLPSAALAEIESLAWPRPVRPGDRLHVRVEITAASLDAPRDHGRVHFLNTAVNEHGETVQTIRGTVFIPRRSAVAQRY